MKTPEEIKQMLDICIHNTDAKCCRKCVYALSSDEADCTTLLLTDALAYIRQLETDVKRYKELFEEKYDELQEAYRTIDGAENCTNCIYGDGTITGTDYCYDCRWFDSTNKRLKWVGVPPRAPEEEER